MKGERMFLGACVNYAKDELEKGASGFHVKTLVSWLRGLCPQIRDGSVTKMGSRVVFMDILKTNLKFGHLNLSNEVDSSRLGDLLDGKIKELESAGDLASAGEFLDALCDAVNKAYDRGNPLFIEL